MLSPWVKRGEQQYTVRVIMTELCDGIFVTEREVHRSISLNGLI